jgi:hypothetical protein
MYLQTVIRKKCLYILIYFLTSLTKIAGFGSVSKFHGSGTLLKTKFFFKVLTY